MICETLEITTDQLKGRTGWDIKPQGACKGEICIPLPSTIMTSDGLVDLQKLAEKLNMPIIHDDAAGLSCLGPEAGGKVLSTAIAPEFELPDWHGKSFQLSSLRGKKVLLIAWASW